MVLLPDTLRPLPWAFSALWSPTSCGTSAYDWSWVLFEELVRAALWFQPAMWVLISRIQSAREETVDELAILATGSRRSYLDALVTFADRPSVFAAAAFARRRHLVQRMLMISKEHVMSSTRVVACSAVLLAVVAGASWYSIEAFPLTTYSASASRSSATPTAATGSRSRLPAAGSCLAQEGAGAAERRELPHAGHAVFSTGCDDGD